MPFPQLVLAEDKIVADKEIDVEIDAFDEFFQGLKNEPLNRPERAILKTYLHYKALVPEAANKEATNAE